MIEGHEADRQRFGGRAEERCKGRAEFDRQIASQRARTDGTQPHQRQHEKVKRSGPRADKNRARHVSHRIDRFADVTGCGFESRRGESD
jgi:hypothetical protein